MSWNILLLSLVGHNVSLVVPSPPSIYSLVGVDTKSEKPRPWCCADTVHPQLKHQCVITTLWSQTQAKHLWAAMKTINSSQDQYRESGGKDGHHYLVETCLSPIKWHIHCRSLSFSPWLKARVSWTSYTWFLGSQRKWIMHLTFLSPHYT